MGAYVEGSELNRTLTQKRESERRRGMFQIGGVNLFDPGGFFKAQELPQDPEALVPPDEFNPVLSQIARVQQLRRLRQGGGRAGAFRNLSTPQGSTGRPRPSFENQSGASSSTTSPTSGPPQRRPVNPRKRGGTGATLPVSR